MATLAHAMEIRDARGEDLAAVMVLASELLGAERAIPFVRTYAERHHILMAVRDGRVVGFLTWRTDWFSCSFVTFVGVAASARRQGVARALHARLEEIVDGPRLYSSVDETNVAAIHMLSALGYAPSGHLDNLPQGYRELFFFKRLPPTTSPSALAEPTGGIVN